MKTTDARDPANECDAAVPKAEKPIHGKTGSIGVVTEHVIEAEARNGPRHKHDRGRATCADSNCSGVESMAGEIIIPSALYSDIFRMKAVWRKGDSSVWHKNMVRPIVLRFSSTDASNVLKKGSDTLLRMTPTVWVFDVRRIAALR